MKAIESRVEHPVKNQADEPGSRLAPNPHPLITNPSRPGSASMPAANVIADPPVRQQPVRRRFSADYKLRVLEEADRCTSFGQIGALLRRQGLYCSHLVTWRRQRKEGSLKALAAGKRGPKVMIRSPLACEVEKLRREIKELRDRLSQAETIIEVQKKVSLLLQSPLDCSTE